MSSDTETLWEDSDHILSRSAEGLILSPASPQPTPNVVAQLEHAFALREQLDEAWALKPRDLVVRDGRPNLTFADPGGEILARHVGEPWRLDAFLRVALGIARAVRQLHERQLVHRDIKPSNIIVDLAAGTARLSGFGLATPPNEPTTDIVGTFAFMSPEQTGRLNRTVDARSDLYSLGVVLYQMLAGRLPFAATTPLEWIHSHIARKAPPLDTAVPAQLAAIVTKLLAKTADDRYATAAGLEHDLTRCLSDLQAQGRIEVRSLGSHDHGHRLLIAERLYGRTDASKQLAAAYKRVSAGATELVVISGYSGIGKTALVAGLLRDLPRDGVRVGRGKFDQYKRDIPYATLAEALQQLVSDILRENDAQLSRWRTALQDALGRNGALLTVLVPELEMLVGPQPAVPDVSVEEAKHRFQLLVQRVLSVFARAEHPLVLFLDDLQWVDRATLDLVRHLLSTGARHLLVVGAYRDNEVSATHPLMRTFEDIKRTGAAVQAIVLGPLPVSEVVTFIVDALADTPGRVRALAQLVHDKTGGNPFFVIQFLLALRDDGLLAFDTATGRWQWDLPRIVARGFTDNLAEFMVGKIGRLPIAARDVLKQFACLGRSASTAHLAALIGETPTALAARLWEAERAGLVVSTRDGYAFPHDRVQEASYALSNERERIDLHRRIARLLLDLEPGRRDDQMFEIANHFNKAAGALSTFEERREVAELDLVASRRSAAAIAFDSALGYVVAGLNVLGADAWTEAPDLAFSLTLQRAHCEFLIGELETSAARLAELTERSPDLLAQCQVTSLRSAVHLTMNETDTAIQVCLDQLRAFGIDWHAQPSAEIVRDEYDKLLSQLPAAGPEALVDLPLMTDPAWRACMDVLLALEPASVFIDKSLHDLGVMRMSNLSIQHGVCDASPLGFSELSLVLWSRFANRALGFRFGELGGALVDQRELRRFAGRVFVVVGHHVMPWRAPVAAALALMRRAQTIATDVGDLVFRQYTMCHIPVLALGAGQPLDDIQRELEGYVAFARRSGFELIVQCSLGTMSLVDTLRGVSSTNAIDEAPFINPERGLEIAACWFWIRRTEAKVYEGDFAAAVVAAERATPLMWTTPSFFERAEYTFYSALAYAGVGDRDRAAALWADLDAWTAEGPETFTSRAALVGAELARLDGRLLDAELSYEAALDATRTYSLVNEEGLVHEIAARFYEERGLRTSARAFRANARACYERWGAYGKVRQLDRGHRGLAPAAGVGTPVRHLDASTVLEIAQAVSSEIVLARLVERLMAIAVEYAGSTRGLLITQDAGGLRLDAEALADERRINVKAVQRALDSDTAPESMLHYVVRTQQIVNLDDASKPNPFSTDGYFAEHHARSVLCFPLVRHGELAAILYLENNLTSHAFTPERIAILRVLASQAAISLENARLYDAMKRTELNLERAQKLSHVGSFGWNIESGAVAWSNEAYAIYGYDPSLVPTADHVVQRLHPDDRDRIITQMTEVMASSTEWQTEFRLVMPDGTVKHAHVTASPVRNERGEREYIGAVMDVTDRRRAELAEVLTLANDRLERDIAERKHLEAQLRAAKDLAEAASQAKNDFLANVSHEIRTPMNAVIGMTELLLESSVSSEQSRWLRTVKSAADNLLVIIEDLLDFSKIEAGKLELDQSSFALREALDDMTRPLQLRAQSKGLQMHLRVESPVPDALLGDLVRLRQVLLNLVDNAVKFTSRGEVEIVVRYLSGSSEHVVLAFDIHDTGIGIPVEKQALIFEAFTQQDTSTTRVYGGTGLGLTIAARLAALMSGSVVVTSEQGRGSTFTFTARFARDRSQSSRSMSQQASAPPSIRSLRILIAEDNDVNAQLVSELLSRRGHRVRVATNGIETLRELETSSFDLAMLDLHMPGMDGFEVIERIRAGEVASGEHLPVIALTARSRPQDRDRCLAAGMDDFLAKPIHASALWSVIERVATATLVDPEALLASCDGDRLILDRLRESLRLAIPREVDALQAALSRNDVRAFQDAAHRLTSMAGAASKAMGSLASTLEDHANLELARPLAARLRAMVPRLLGELGDSTLERLQANRRPAGQ